VLTIGPHLIIEPPDGIVAHRAADGTLLPFEQTYTITNHDMATNTVRTTVDEGCDWVWINYGLGATKTLGPYDSTRVRVTIDREAAADFDSDQSCAVIFENVTSGQGSTSITMTVEVPDITPQLDPPAMAVVPAADPQPNGPNHDFALGTLEITNDQFVTFLNDARAHPDDPRGEYLYVNADTGHVFVHTERVGAIGPAVGETLVFDPAVNGHVTFDGTSYGLDDPAYGVHPVVGVTWYGAVKFSNWLTLDQGLGAAERAYGEGTVDALPAWRPVTVSESDWLDGRFTGDDRFAWVTLYRGYRLPMDGESLDAAPYNEWYKAAAWRPDLGRNMRYGYGRDTFSGADANVNASGDPYDGLSPGTTPVGYYNGEVHEGYTTHVTTNGYGAYDLTGNVFEWMTDLYGGYTKRAIRGGSWAFGDAADPGIDNRGRLFVFPDRAYDQVGFRIARAGEPEVSPGDFDRDGDLDNDDYTAFTVCLAGPAAAVVPGATLDLDADLDIDLADFAIWQRLVADGP
jgi:formylglycine-generating enzyme required for sulfatase activity